MNNVQTFINKVSADSQFRTDLLDDPSDALQNAGFTPNPTTLAILGRLVGYKDEISHPGYMDTC